MELWNAVTPLLDWPSSIHGPMRQDEAERLLVEEGPAGDVDAVAYLLAAYIAECEFSDGGGSELADAAEDFMRALERNGTP